MSREKTKAVLNQAIADLSQFAAVIHQIHWYVRGSKFFSVHELMDKYLDEVNENIDELAERLIIIGGAPYSTLDEFAKASKIESKKGDYNISLDEHIRTLLSGYRYLGSLYKEGIAAAAEEGDDVTEGLFADLLGASEKTIWMLAATLNEAPNL